MSDNTKIEWTDATWNPITGCSVVSPGCTNCYAMKLAGTRLKHHPTRAGLTVDTKAGPVWNGQVRFNEGVLTQPLKWKRPRMIFVCAHGDLFHPDVPDAWIDQVFAVMALASHHTFQVLTKRPERMREYLAQRSDAISPSGFFCPRINHVLNVADRMSRHAFPAAFGDLAARARDIVAAGHFPNVWLGTSVEDQRRADERIPHLLQTPAAIRFLSAEPILGPIDLTNLQLPGSLSWNALGKLAGLHWVIAGGESGPGARPMHPHWARSLRDQCNAAGVAFFFKQWGAWSHRPDMAHLKPMLVCEWQRLSSQVDGVRPALMVNEGKKAAGRLLDGVEHNGMPVNELARFAA
jgi:protein gp37